VQIGVAKAASFSPALEVLGRRSLWPCSHDLLSSDRCRFECSHNFGLAQPLKAPGDEKRRRYRLMGNNGLYTQLQMQPTRLRVTRGGGGIYNCSNLLNRPLLYKKRGPISKAICRAEPSPFLQGPLEARQTSSLLSASTASLIIAVAIQHDGCVATF
jgi:hypothetical protein